jgi:predicted RNase H-like HicB family nuclease
MRRYTVLLYPGEDCFVATIPAFGDLATQGRTVEEALDMAKDAIDVATRGLIEDGEPVPEEDPVPIVAAVEVAEAEAVSV